MARLLLVRHGITEWNIVHRIQGHTDNDLNEKGTRQVERVGERLAGEKIDAVFASDLKRTLSTARQLSAAAISKSGRPLTCGK